MTHRNRIPALLLGAALLLGMTLSALAAPIGTGYTDVPADADYAEAVLYCRENGLMDGVGDGRFAPEGSMTRAMAATVLYRMAGRPATAGNDRFTDTIDALWYGPAILWADATGVMSGYGGGLFGPNDLVTREQLATLLWRYAGSPAAAGGGTAFADEGTLFPWSEAAVAWAREAEILQAHAGNLFEPRTPATRAEVAVALMRFTLALDPDAPVPTPTPTPTPEPETGDGVLVAYFSATGNTEGVAQMVAAAAGGTLYEITPAVPYTAADLNYSNSSSRSQREQRDASARPALAGADADMDAYGVILLGYPIWNGQAPKIVSTFLERYDLAGKIIVPFCTSGSSGIGTSASSLHALAPTADWREGRRFAAGASQSTVTAWVESLGLPQPTQEEEEAAMRLSVTANGRTVVFELNDSAAARALYAQLPLSVELENYSNNEKIFYPPQALDVTGAPLAEGGAGTLAYYAPWGDVVLFYGAFSGNRSLYGLGHAVEGAADISSLSGTASLAAAR